MLSRAATALVALALSQAPVADPAPVIEGARQVRTGLDDSDDLVFIDRPSGVDRNTERVGGQAPTVQQVTAVANPRRVDIGMTFQL